jgi:hypothetical protein
MPIGDPFTQNVPVVGDSGTQYATDVNEVLEELIDRVSLPVPFSVLEGDALDLGNVPGVDFKYLALYDQSVTPAASPVNRFESYEGEVYWINASGALKMTNAGALNAAGLGGIGGDYGGVDPALVTFVAAANRYDFYDDFAGLIWAKGRFGGIDIAATGSTGTGTSTVYGQLRYGGLASLTFTLPATLPGSNRSVMVISSAGQMAFNDSTNTVTNDIVLGGSTKIQHGSRIIEVDVTTYQLAAGTVVHTLGFPVVTANPATVIYYLPNLIVGWTITSIKMICRKESTGNTNIILRQRQNGSTTNIDQVVDTTIANPHTITLSGLTEVVTVDTSYSILIDLPATNDYIYHLQVTYQQDA